MPPHQGDDLGAQIGVRVPANLNTAAEQVANKRNFEIGAHGTFTKSNVVREALNLYFYALALSDDLPEETRDLLDGDLEADAGVGLQSPPVLEKVDVDLVAVEVDEGNPRRAAET